MKRLLVVALAVVCGGSYGFKIGTHVWIAQETINNLKSCKAKTGRSCIRVASPDSKYEREIDIPEEVAQAIAEYPEYYRNGNIGPDAYPDILVGQTVIHPGVTHEHHGKVEAKGFGTGEFLDLFLRKANEVKGTEEKKQALAFAYGMLGHAASDTFAHSYVNAYSGDEFLLTDGENDVEKRHVALEDYINQKTPHLNKAHKLLERDGKLAIPAELIRDVLVYGKESIEEYEKVPSTTSHIVLVRNLREEILRNLKMKDPNMDWGKFAKGIAERYWDQLKGSWLTKDHGDSDALFQDFLDKTAKEWPGGNVQDAEVLAIQILAYYFLDLSLTQEEAAFIADFSNKVHEATTKAPKEIAALNNRINEWVNTAVRFQGKVVGTVNNELIKQAAQLSNVGNHFLDQITQIQEVDAKWRQNKARWANEKNRKLCNQIRKSACEIPEIVKTEDVCKKLCPPGLGRVCKNVCKKVDKVVQKAGWNPACLDKFNACEAQHKAHEHAIRGHQKAHEALSDQIAKLRKTHSRTEDELMDFARRVDAGVQAIHRQVEELLKKKQAMEADLGAAVVRVSHGHREQMNRWVADIDNSVKEYVIANGRAMQNTMDENENTGFLTPLSDWMACYFPSILGVPQEISNITLCAARQVSGDFKAEYEKLVAEFEKVVRTIDPKIAGKLLDARDRWLKEGPYMAAKKLNGPFKDLIGNGKYDLVLTLHIASANVTRGILNKTFATDESGKHLIQFPQGEGSIADRVDAEMHLVDGKFDAEKYAPVVNARNLSALSLLDANGIRVLGAGTPVEKMDISNLITKSIRSIDGSYQWMEVAPPFPRAERTTRDSRWVASCEDTSNVARRYGYGFPLYQVQEAKKEVFERLFAGPLNPGLLDVLPSDYPYLASEKEPFPEFINGCSPAN